MSKRIYFIVLLFTLSGHLFAQDFEWMPDRRKDQFPTEAAHLVVPLPYSYPGIGEGIFLMGNLSNVGETTMDGVLIAVLGDATGMVFQGDEIPIIDQSLLLHVYLQNINRAVVNNYEIRGMNSNQAYNLLDVTRADENKFELKYTLMDRRFNFFLNYHSGDFALDRILDSNGNELQVLDEPYTQSTSSYSIGFSLDFTDDYLDPRRGFRFELTLDDHPPDSSHDPDYYTLDYNALFYIPYAGNDVLVMNYYQSDAHVREIGNVNSADIIADLGLNCGTDASCLNIEQQLVDNTINERIHGTATSLGGLDRLRAYPQGRFQGGHMAFFGMEYRWNMVDEQTPFNYGFWKDVRTGTQIAFFAEVGTVAETSADVWDESRSAYGVGFRLVTASGSVYRADFATGEEGTESAIFFFYPW